MNRDSIFRRVETGLTAVAAGKFVVVADSADREDEGDLILAAEEATPEALAFMIRYTSGIVCVPLPGERLRELGLPRPRKCAGTRALRVFHGRPPWLNPL
jgi:3,4-dihydroxy-2-butanone 4-phosphate synthase